MKYCFKFNSPKCGLHEGILDSWKNENEFLILCVCLVLFVCSGTYVTQVTATDADDSSYGNSARVVYSIVHGQPYFSVDPKTGENMQQRSPWSCREISAKQKAAKFVCLVFNTFYMLKQLKQ